MKFALEPYSTQVWHEMKPMLRAHHAEIANRFYGPFDPDIEFYDRAKQMTRIFTMRQQDQLAGYQIYFILGDPHCHGRLQAVQDILYVEPEFRKGLMAYRFMRWCVDQLKDVDIVVQRISAHHDFGKLFERMGFKLEDLTYCKEV